MSEALHNNRFDNCTEKPCSYLGTTSTFSNAQMLSRLCIPKMLQSLKAMPGMTGLDAPQQLHLTVNGTKDLK